VELARAEPDRLTGDVADRPDDSATEPVVDAALAGRDETGRRELIARAPLCAQRLEHVVPAAGGVADAEMGGGARIEPALAEEAPRALRLGAEQLRPEVLPRRGVGGVQPAAAAGLRRGPAVFVMQRV